MTRSPAAIQQNANNFRARQAVHDRTFLLLVPERLARSLCDCWCLSGIPVALLFSAVSISNVCLSCRYAAGNALGMSPRWPCIASLSAHLHSLTITTTVIVTKLHQRFLISTKQGFYVFQFKGLLKLALSSFPQTLFPSSQSPPVSPRSSIASSTSFFHDPLGQPPIRFHCVICFISTICFVFLYL